MISETAKRFTDYNVRMGKNLTVQQNTDHKSVYDKAIAGYTSTAATGQSIVTTSLNLLSPFTASHNSQVAVNKARSDATPIVQRLIDTPDEICAKFNEIYTAFTTSMDAAYGKIGVARA